DRAARWRGAGDRPQARGSGAARWARPDDLLAVVPAESPGDWRSRASRLDRSCAGRYAHRLARRRRSRRPGRTFAGARWLRPAEGIADAPYWCRSQASFRSDRENWPGAVMVARLSWPGWLLPLKPSGWS